MKVLSLQSRVAYGHVGNSAAVPVLQRLGHETWPIDTTLLSNHLGYASYGGRILPADDVAAVAEGLAKLGLVGRADALLSGFLGLAAGVAAGLAEKLRAAKPDALYCLDPVMGERQTGLYVHPTTVEAIGQRLVPLADILTPNAFELDQLAGRRSRTLADVVAAAQELRRRARPGAVVVATGLDREDGPPQLIEVLVASAAGLWLGEVERLVCPAHGGGDLFAALFFGHYLTLRDLPATLARAMDATHAVFSRSIGAIELALTESLPCLADPPRTAKVRKLD